MGEYNDKNRRLTVRRTCRTGILKINKRLLISKKVGHNDPALLRGQDVA